MANVVQSVEVDVSTCPISGVVVYLDRADVTRSVEVELTPGENEVIVKELSRVIDSDSIRYGNASVKLPIIILISEVRLNVQSRSTVHVVSPKYKH